VGVEHTQHRSISGHDAHLRNADAMIDAGP
jgi:hypothetical protein